VLDVIRGRTYEDALMMLEYMPYRACEPILKTLISVRCLHCRASPQAAASLPRKLCFAHQCGAGTVRHCAGLAGLAQLCSHVLTLDSNFAAQSPTEFSQQQLCCAKSYSNFAALCEQPRSVASYAASPLHSVQPSCYALERPGLLRRPRPTQRRTRA